MNSGKSKGCLGKGKEKAMELTILGAQRKAMGCSKWA
jgi:hypothetical protein